MKRNGITANALHIPVPAIPNKIKYLPECPINLAIGNESWNNEKNAHDKKNAFFGYFAGNNNIKTDPNIIPPNKKLSK